eukprot:12912946-Prorocentrum_lima.AAC.1
MALQANDVLGILLALLSVSSGVLVLRISVFALFVPALVSAFRLSASWHPAVPLVMSRSSAIRTQLRLAALVPAFVPL